MRTPISLLNLPKQFFFNSLNLIFLIQRFLGWKKKKRKAEKPPNPEFLLSIKDIKSNHFELQLFIYYFNMEIIA